MSKICYLTYQSFPSVKANTIQTISNLKYFVRNGYDVELIFPLREKNSSDKLADLQEFYSFNEYIKVRGVKHNYPFGKVFLFEKLFFLFSHLLWSKKIVNNLIKSNDIDYTFFTRSEWIAYFLSQQKLNVLYECHQSSKIKKLLVPLIIKNKKSKIIFLNENLNKSFNLKKKFYSRISTLHNGVDSELFDENIEKNINDIIFVGNLLRFNKKRDIEFLINSFKDTRLSKKYNLKIVGGPENERMRLGEHIEKNNLENKVKAIGELGRKDTIIEIQKSEIGLLINTSDNLHSTHYTSPLKYFEYLYGGLKIVAVDFPAHRNLPFSDNITYFNENNLEEFIKSLEKASYKQKIEKDKLKDITLDSRVKRIIEIIEM